MDNKTYLKVACKILLLFVFVAAARTAHAKIIYVDDDAAGANEGSSWADAFNYLQDALNAAWPGDEIRVAQGLYKPDQGTGITQGDREATFPLTQGVIIMGGYAGAGTPDPNARNIEAYEAVLSGDLNGNDVEVTNPANLLYEPTRAENSFHVVTATDTDETAVLDGFTITAGNANSPSFENPNSNGGGMFNDTGSPTVTNCTFSTNSAKRGGGMGNWQSRPTITNCTLSGNSGEAVGGGMFNYHSNPTVTNCKFSGNSAGVLGGGMFNEGSASLVTNCTFSGNSADKGGGMSTDYSGRATVINCTFSGNSAGGGGGMYNGSQSGSSSSTLINCILWGNTAPIGPQIYNFETGWADVWYSDIQGGWLGEGNIDADPCFVESGYWDTDSVWVEGDYHLLPGSPCIDAGDNSAVPPLVVTDLDGNYRIANGTVDMGVYEFGSTLLSSTLFVDSRATGANNGSSWVDAFADLQEALTIATAFPQVDEIWVAQGIYKPAGYIPPPPLFRSNNEDESIESAADRTATFQLINGVTLKGGYAGLGQTDPNAHDIQLYESILTGDLAGNDADITNPRYLLNESTRAENSYHVVTGSGTNETAVLDGFTITGGYAESPNKYGGGMYNYSGRPTISSCIFTKNWAEDNGGGMYNSQSSPVVFNCKFIGNYTDEDDDDEGGSGMCNEASRPTLINCVFSDNWASFQGGGMYNRGDSRPRLINCVFSNNIGYQGGGMSNWHSNTTLIECTFSRNKARTGGGMENGWSSLTIRSCMFSANEAGYGGGAMFNYRSSPTLTNCIFSGNLAGWRGGGIENWTNNSLTVFNCTFSSNSADEGNTLACWSWPQDPPSELFLTNCILWDGGNEIWNNDDSVITITYTDVQGGWSGEGNIDADPCFVEPRFWEANGVLVDGDYHLLPDSPCIDAGDPNYPYEPNEMDLDGKPRVINGRIDMGAYEYSPPIPAEVRFVPNTINLRSKGKWITAYVGLPEEYNVADIDPNSVLLASEIKPEKFWLTEDNQIAIAKFDREVVQDILSVGEIELTITGHFIDGTFFTATDTVKVIEKAGKK